MNQKITLKAARVNKGLTQEQAAKKIGISKSTLQKYEAGVSVPNWEVVKKIEEMYGFNADSLYFAREYA